MADDSGSKKPPRPIRADRAASPGHRAGPPPLPLGDARAAPPLPNLEAPTIELELDPDLLETESEGEVGTGEGGGAPVARTPGGRPLSGGAPPAEQTVRADIARLTAVARARPEPPAPRSSAGRRPVLPPPRAPARSPGAKPVPSAGAPVMAGDDDPQTRRRREVIEACEHELRRVRDDLQAARIHLEIALAHELLGGRISVAREHYQRAVKGAPSLLAALRGARRLALDASAGRAGGQGDPAALDEAMRLFDVEIAASGEGAAVALAFDKAGRSLRRGGVHVSAAIRDLERALELDPGNISVIERLAVAQRRAKDDGGIDGALERLADALVGEPRARAAVVALRGRHVELRRGDADRAIELYDRALELDPEVGGVQAALERLLHGGGRWRALAVAIARRVERSPSPAAAAAALLELATIQLERLGEVDAAAGSLRRAAQLCPEDPAILDELVRLHQRRGDHRALAEALARRVELTEAPRERLAPLHRLGALHDEQLEDPEGAMGWYARALEIDPAYVPTLRAHARLLARAERWSELVDMHVAAASSFDDELRRADAHARAAELLETRLGRPELAIEHHARALALLPELDDSFKALVRLHTAAGQPRAVVELYERAFDRAKQPDLQLTYLFKIAALEEDALRDPVSASRAYERALQIDGKQLGALHGLQRTREAAGDWRGLVDALERELALVPTQDRARQVALLHRAGVVLADELDDPEGALERLRRAQALDGRHPRVLASLGRLFHREGRWRELLEVFTRELELAARPSEKAELCFKMGEIAETQLRDPALALRHYGAAAAHEAGHRGALAAQARLHEASGDHRGLCGVLERELQQAAGPRELARLAYRLGVVLESRLDDGNQAAAAYRRALEADPRHLPSLAGLGRVLERTRRWDQAVEELLRQAELAEEAPARGEFLLRASELLAERLDRPEEAVAALEERRRQLPDEHDALLRLGPLYEGLESWDRLARLLIERASRFELPAARRAALVQLAELVVERDMVGEHDPRAIYEAVLGIDARDRIALAGLERTSRGAAAAEHRLGAALRSARLESDPSLRAEAWLRVAEARREGDPSSAVEAYAEALEHDPRAFVALRGLADTAEQLDDPGLKVEVRRLEANWTGDGERAARLLVASARIAREQLGEDDAALADLEAALRRGPDDAEAAAALDALLVARRQEPALVDKLRDAARRASSGSRRLALWLRISELQSAPPIDDIGAAIASLEHVVEEDPKAVEARLALARLHGRSGGWKAAAEQYEQALAQSPARDVAMACHLALAQLSLQRLGDPARAAKQVEALLALQPGHREGLLLAVDLHVREAEYEKAETLANRLLRASSSADERGQALARLGSLQLRNAERERGLASLLEAVSLIGPRTEPGRRYRDEVAERGATEGYAAAIATYLGGVERGELDDDDPGATYLELARVYDAVAAPEQAVEALSGALRLREEDADLRAGLAIRLQQLGRHAEAEAQWREVLGLDLLRADLWRGLARALGQLQRAEEGRLALGPLVVLGEASAEEAALAGHARTRPGLARPGSFGRAALQKISAGPAVEGRILDLLLAMRDVYGKVFAPDLSVYGLSPRDKIPPGASHPLRPLVDRIAAAFEVERFDLYVHQVQHGLVVEMGGTPSVMVPAFLGQLGESQQVFLLARAFMHLAFGSEAAVRLGPEQLAITLAATAQVFGHQPDRGLEAAAVEEMSRRIARGVPWLGKKALEEAAGAYAAMPRIDTHAWIDSLDRSATRAAALLCGDIAGAVEIVRRTDPSLHDRRGVELVAVSPVLEDLLRFWLSPPAVALRQAAGLM